MWNELTILWNDLTIDWNDLTWNNLTMERNDRLPFLLDVVFACSYMKGLARLRYHCQMWRLNHKSILSRIFDSFSRRYGESRRIQLIEIYM